MLKLFHTFFCTIDCSFCTVVERFRNQQHRGARRSTCQTKRGRIFDIVSHHLVIESQSRVAFQKQKPRLEATQLLDRLNVATTQVARHQRRTARHLEKAQKGASRQREKGKIHNVSMITSHLLHKLSHLPLSFRTCFPKTFY
jgi:hypothetical protein